MRHFILFLLGITILAMFACNESVDTEADLASIEKAGKRIIDALTIDDVDAVMAELSKDHITMAPNEPAIVDIEKVRSLHEDRVRLYSLHCEFSTQEVQVAGDWAFQYWTLKYINTPKAEGDPFQDALKGIWIWQRQQDGDWKLSRSIWNSDNPIQTDH
jgi:ketosteroid isomerase-like protein